MPTMLTVPAVLILVACVILCSLGFGGLATAQAADDQPNIVFVFIDDMGYGDLSCTGNSDVDTVHWR